MTDRNEIKELCHALKEYNKERGGTNVFRVVITGDGWGQLLQVGFRNPFLILHRDNAEELTQAIKDATARLK